MKKSHLLAYGAIAILFAASGAWYGTRQKAAPPPLTSTVQPGVSAPVDALFAQSLADDKGVQQALAQWKGKPLLVNFWAPWCGPCVQEMPELSALQAGGKYKNLQVIGIGIDSPTNIADFTQKFKIAYPVYVAGVAGTELSRQLGNAQGGLPYTVLIGADGQVRKTYLGRLKFDLLEKDLAAL
ncbi:TlpA family protein disulfide reductase [Pseudoduganella buxea]|uniref:Redoxin family protein n=1 Tax=Pseudoduganella buxea TaxID=1949069 RepID=A0A6I3ST68_9BURK|nr:TlpA disulfide reductase family protein [Pseudoduganella buxea]MTV51876.1 redoxin family protein [Pseudoduganella buxea]GGB98543.1 thioredoxin [Pseudoduganella buxea]